jgi:hypothetical protein
MKRTIRIKMALADHGAIKFDSDGSARLVFQADATQVAEVAGLLVASETLIDAALTFDDAARAGEDDEQTN